MPIEDTSYRLLEKYFLSYFFKCRMWLVKETEDFLYVSKNKNKKVHIS